MKTVLITGGSGLIGNHLSKRLLSEGYHVSILSRTKQQDSDLNYFLWDIDKGIIESEAITTADYVMHLAGANIADGKWTKKRKQQILNSRIKSTHLLFNEAKKQQKELGAFISASAIGYYGAVTSDHIFVESDPPSSDFLGDTCSQWEQVVDRFTELDIRTVKLRTGIVLTPHKGALSKMITPIKLGLGSPIGSGQQYMPWVHINDLCDIYIQAIERTNMSGVYNAVAPDHKTNAEFGRAVAQVLKKPFIAPRLPAFTMKLMFGEMSALLLQGSRVSSDKIVSTGFNFQFPYLDDALNNLIDE